MAESHCRLALSSSLLLLVVAVCSSNPGSAKTGATQKSGQQQLTSSEIVESLRAAEVTDPNYKLSATQANGQLIVTTQKNPKFNDDDTKVQGVLIAKTAFDLLPDSVQRTKVLFHDLKDGSFAEVVISRTEIESYGKGLIDQKKLLGSLEIEKRKPEGSSVEPEQSATTDPASVVDGPMKTERLEQFGNIQFLRSKGADVSKLEQIFAAQESQAEANNEKSVSLSLKSISSIITEQKKAFLNAQATANGKSVSLKPSTTQQDTQTKVNAWTLLKVLKRRGIDVDSQMQELYKVQNDTGLSVTEVNRRKDAIAVEVMAKFHSLPLQEQAELNNSLSFMGNRSAKPDNGFRMKRRFERESNGTNNR